MRHIAHFIEPAARALTSLRAAGHKIAFPVRFALLAGAYFAAARLSHHFALAPGMASPLWPPSAIALCACLAWGRGMVPAVWLGAAMSQWTVGVAPAIATVIGLGAGLEAWVAALLVSRRLGQRPDFSSHETVFRFIGIAAGASMIAATVSAGTLAWTIPLAAGALALNWLTWWVGDAAGMILLVPLLLCGRSAIPRRWKPAAAAEAVIFAIALTGIAQLVFSDALMGVPLAYVPIPFVLWAAFRFGLAAVTWTTGTICAIAVWNTARGSGPFTLASMNASLLLVMLYISIIGTMGLVLAGLVARRRLAEQTLRSERDELERRVQSRTHELLCDLEKRRSVEQQLEQAQRLAQIGSWNWDLGSDQITWSDELYRIYGVDKDFRLSRTSCRALIHEDDMAMLARLVRDSQQSGTPFQAEHRIRLPSGAVKTVDARGYAEKDESGRVRRMFGTVQDITQARQAEAARHETEARYRTLVEVSPDAIMVQQDGVFLFVNRAACNLLAADRPDRLVGRPVFDVIHPDFHEVARKRMECVQRGETVGAVDETLVRLDGSELEVEVNAAPILHQGRFATLVIARDVTERKKSAQQMAWLAHYDALTGLPNRILFRQRLEHALVVAERPGQSLEILFLDLDRFKTINDTLGHAVGDLVLKEAAARLQGILRESDTVARLGGDEFVVLVENVDEPHRGGTIAEKILAAFKPPFLQDREPMTIGASIGVASFPSDGTDADTLLKNADIAMYRAKESGRNNYRYYSPEMNRHTTERLALEFALGHALSRGQLSLYYQPKVDLLSNRISGMEALLRWWHPTLGLLGPQKFLAIAEETGLIIPIGYWTIRTACLQNKRWQESGPARLRVAVNLSPRQLADSNLVAGVREILEDTGLQPHYLELEITENAMMANPEKTTQVLSALRELGVSVAIDDFGTGYSSFAHLKQLAVRAVKIDRSFVQGLPQNRGDSAVTKAIISLAHSLECSVIAEGAETQQQFEFLREHDCDSVQGHYFSEPMSPEVFGDLLRVQANLHMH